MEYSGKVEKGYGRGGKALNCPTANINATVPTELRHGVWVGRATLNNTVYNAVANIGVAPFYKDANRRPIIEVHLLDYNGPDFYDQYLHVTLIHWMRSERSDFDSENELKECIQQDILQARQILASRK